MRVTQHTQDRDDSIGARPIGPPVRKRGPLAWLALLALLIIGVIVVLLLLSRCGDGGDDPTAAAPAPSAVPSPSSAATAGSSPAASGASGTIVANGQTMLPLAGSSTDNLSSYAGQTASTTSVRVQSVPADEGFWVGSGAGDRVWIQLTGAAGESPFTVKAGDSVAFTGTVTKNPDGFANQVGVTTAEGASMLDSQGYHIAVTRSALKLAT